MPPLDWTQGLQEVLPQGAQAAAPAQPDASWAAALPEVTDHPAATPEPLQAAPGHTIAGPSGNWLTDLGRRAGSAVINAGVGLVSPLQPTAAAGVGPSGAASAPLLHALGITDTTPPATPEQAKSNAYNALGATEYQPETPLGRMTQSGLTAAVGGVTNPASIPALVGGGMTSELGRELFPNHPVLASMAGFLPGAWGAKALSNMPLPPSGGMDPETAALANASTKNYGVPLAAGQLSGNPFIRLLYSEGGKLPFSGAERSGGMQQGAFNQAVAGTFGEAADKITPEVMQAAKSRIGNVFNDVAARTQITQPATTNLLNNFANIETNAQLVLTPQEWAPIGKQLDNILGKVQPGDTISGDAYQSLTRKGTPLDLAVNSPNPNLRQWGGQIRSALDDALQQSASPTDLAALKEARSQWKAMRTVEPLTLRADAVGGVTPSTGDVSPAALRAAVNRSYGNAAFAPLGQIPLNDLAKIGQKFLKEPPDSNTATRNVVQHGIGAAGALGATLMGEELGVPRLTAAGGVAGGLLANRLAQGVLRSPALANRAIQAGMNPGGFRFTYPTLPQQLPAYLLPAPFGWGPPATGANSGSGQ